MKSKTLSKLSAYYYWFPIHYLVHVHFINDNNGMVSGQGGVLLKTINGGTTWTKLASGTTVELAGIFMLNTNTAFAE